METTKKSNNEQQTNFGALGLSKHDSTAKCLSTQETSRHKCDLQGSCTKNKFTANCWCGWHPLHS